MEIIDISMEIHKGIPVWRNNDRKRPEHKIMQDYSAGSVYESRMAMDLHTGTHMDAPLHMIENGDTIDHFDLKKSVTRCKVVDLTKVEDHITRKDLEKHPIDKGDFLLLKTRNSEIEGFDEGFVFVDREAAEYLNEMQIKGVGIDSLGIERSQPDHETHKVLLGNGIAILEGLRLKNVPEGEYVLIAAPLKIRNAEASPVRALLIKDFQM